MDRFKTSPKIIPRKCGSEKSNLLSTIRKNKLRNIMIIPKTKPFFHVISLLRSKRAENFKINPPGFYGFRYGIKAGFMYTNLGYARKFDTKKIIKYGKRIKIHH